MEWQVAGFSQLDSYTVYAMLQLRVDVFVVEQNCPYPELDNKDLHPQTRHILLKKGDKIFGQVTFICRIQSADNATIDPNILWVQWFVRGDKNIAGMHVGMEKTVAEYLSEKYFNATFGQ